MGKKRKTGTQTRTPPNSKPKKGLFSRKRRRKRPGKVEIAPPPQTPTSSLSPGNVESRKAHHKPLYIGAQVCHKKREKVPGKQDRPKKPTPANPREIGKPRYLNRRQKQTPARTVQTSPPPKRQARYLNRRQSKPQLGQCKRSHHCPPRSSELKRKFQESRQAKKPTPQTP